MLDLYGCDLLDGGVTLVLAEHHLPRGLARNHKLASTVLLEDDELPLQSTGDTNTRRQFHEETMTDATQGKPRLRSIIAPLGQNLCHLR